MKKAGLGIFIILLSLSIKAQNKISASINSSCVSQPANLAVPSGKVVSGFVLKILEAGNNCYSGASFSNKGFAIKGANGNVVYRYTQDKNGKITERGGKLSTLKLRAGTYTFWVDGGKGAQLVLSYRI